VAFDDATRGRLQTFVTKARLVLTDEFTKQFQQDFGLDPISGTVSPLESLSHLDDQRLATARLLREIFDHYLPAAMSGGEEARKTTLDRMVREQAFTTLNRLAALRMMEARGLARECVGKGYQSQAFQLYQRVAGTALGETGDAYRVFLLSLCDVYCTDLPILFDRHFPNGRLFPREPALLPLLDLINDLDIAPLWGEDETIGWIYQYFNSKEERQAMRDPKQGGSQAPRSSRELAVRNQFFTPRYVVEFLVDNTLGRLWFNLTGGRTGVRDRCQYLLVKSDEQPEAAKRLRDPRTIKLLDPACGSMHFGLYAFDLFLDIYREAWVWEQEQGPGCLDVTIGGGPDFKPLCQTYGDEDAFLRDVPRLIIEHNIYGVDIDPRAAQIASLALWLRAQRAWHQMGVKAKDRPQVGQGHVVAAVAPPAEMDLRKRFMEGLDPLDAELFEQTLFMLKGLPELGVLLQVEKELPALIRKVFGEHGALFRTEDVTQWHKAEARLREALVDYARAARSTYQGRLFAEDALQGLRMIDLCREVFDTVVMNPPFGASTADTSDYIQERYHGFHSDIYASFVSRAISLTPSGMVGCISSRSFLMAPRQENFRKKAILPRITCLADFGLGVMDDAHVESAAYVLSSQPGAEFSVVDLRKEEKSKEIVLKTSVARQAFTSLQRDWFLTLPKAKILYDAPSEVRHLLSDSMTFEPEIGTAREGMKSFDNFRFIRLWWEVSYEKIGRGAMWRRFSKGGDFSFFFLDTILLLNWDNEGAELQEVNRTLNGSTSQVRQASTYWYRPGVTYSKRSAKGFSARALPADTIFTSNGPAILSTSGFSPAYILGWANSKIIRGFLHLQSNFGDYSTGSFKKLPWTSPDSAVVSQIEDAAVSASQAALKLSSRSKEISPWFLRPSISGNFEDCIAQLSRLANAAHVEQEKAISLASDLLADVYSIADMEWADGLIDETSEEVDARETEPTIPGLEEQFSRLFVSYAIGLVLGRWHTLLSLDSAEPLESTFDPFGALPNRPPGFLAETSPSLTLANSIQVHPEYLEPGGIVDSDSSKSTGLAQKFQVLFDSLPGGAKGVWEIELCRALGVKTLNAYFQDSNGFFADHLSEYSGSGRLAPIYWPLSTASSSYTLWLYYPRLTSQTLYTAVNDFVEPKLKQVSRDAATLRDKGSARSRDDEKAFEALQSLELELIELRDTLLQIAPTYRPNHDDGVQIAAAPLWQLFRHRPWRKILQDTWAKLETGDYDWAHLAMAYWPERVREKCKTDKSLAIAHDLERLYVEPAPKPARSRGKKGAGA
jgi:hypothetical protein